MNELAMLGDKSVNVAGQLRLSKSPREFIEPIDLADLLAELGARALNEHVPMSQGRTWRAQSLYQATRYDGNADVGLSEWLRSRAAASATKTKAAPK